MRLTNTEFLLTWHRLKKMYNNRHPPLQGNTNDFLTSALSMASSSFPFLRALAITDLVNVSKALPFSEYVFGIIYCVVYGFLLIRTTQFIVLSYLLEAIVTHLYFRIMFFKISDVKKISDVYFLFPSVLIYHLYACIKSEKMEQIDWVFPKTFIFRI